MRVAAWALVVDGALTLLTFPLLFIHADYAPGFPLWVLELRPFLLAGSVLLGLSAGIGLLRGRRWGARLARVYAVAIITAGVAALASLVVQVDGVSVLTTAILGLSVLGALGALDIALGAFVLWALRAGTDS